MIFEEYEGIEGGVRLQYDLMNPLNKLDVIKDPSADNLASLLYWPAITTGGFYAAAWMTGTSLPPFWVRVIAAPRPLYSAATYLAPYMAAPVMIGAAYVGHTELLDVAYDVGGMDPIPHSGGAREHPFAGGSSRYPGQGIVEFIQNL